MAGKDITINKNELLFKEGDESRSLFLVKTGTLKVFKTKTNGDQIEIGVVQPNEIIGEMAFIDGSPRSASAAANTKCEIVEIDFESLKKFIASQPPWFSAMLKSITGRLRDANNRIKQLESAVQTISYKKGRLDPNSDKPPTKPDK